MFMSLRAYCILFACVAHITTPAPATCLVLGLYHDLSCPLVYTNFSLLPIAQMEYKGLFESELLLRAMHETE